MCAQIAPFRARRNAHPGLATVTANGTGESTRTCGLAVAFRLSPRGPAICRRSLVRRLLAAAVGHVCFDLRAYRFELLRSKDC